MKIYNTLTRKKEEFIPINNGEIKIYVCGPTVYNYIHIGNSRPLCVFDVVRRYFEYLGYKVIFVQNFTDIDDKIIKKALEENSDFSAISEKYIKEYEKDAQGLNIEKATFHPKATENIKEIISLIENLIKKDYAYCVENGDVYFRTRKFKEYGKLSHQSLDDLQAGARIQVDEIKENPLDFALWKSAKSGEPFWESPWGKGRPGWHIECSAMVKKYLGTTIDIHCGGQDLIFPHHENEIAQSECCNGVQFAKYWLHNGYININSQKMSKSLGNFFTVREIAEKYGYEPIRYLMISSHYRNPINFSEDIVIQCRAALDRLHTFKKNLEFALKHCSEIKNISAKPVIKLTEYKEKFENFMNDDLNTADALSVIFDLVKNVNAHVLSSENYIKNEISDILEFFNEITNVLGIVYEEKRSNNEITEEEIKNLLVERTQARNQKNWKRADEIREELKSKNVIIEDTPKGTTYTFK